MHKFKHNRVRRITTRARQTLAGIGRPVPESTAAPDPGSTVNRDTAQHAGPQSAECRFQDELFAGVLLELPLQRERLAAAYNRRDMPALGQAVHFLLGAVSYCDAIDLEDALRALRGAIESGEQAAIARQHAQVLTALDSTLARSGMG